MSGAYTSTTSGDIQYIELSSGQTYYVVSGGTAEGCTVVSGGLLQPSSGGTVFDTIISGGYQFTNGGETYTYAGGNVQVGVGGVASGSQIYGNGNQYENGEQDVEGGVAYDTVIYDGGRQVVDSNAAYNTTISNGGQQNVKYGGSAFMTTVASGGVEYLGPSAVDYGTVVQSGGQELVNQGATANSLDVEAGGEVFIRDLSGPGVVNDVTLQAGGVLFDAGAVLSGTSNIMSGSTLVIGGVATFTYNDAPVTDVITAVVFSGYTLDDGVTEIINSGNSDANVALGNNSDQDVMGGASVTSDTFDNNATQYVSGGGVATGDQVQSGGTVVVSTSGSVVSGDILSGGQLLVSSGGTASETFVQDGLFRDYGSASETEVGGTTFATVAYSLAGGALVVQSTGYASGSVISAGGEIQVDSGGVAAETTLTDGLANVQSGGILSGVDLNGTGAVPDGSYDGVYAFGTVISAEVSASQQVRLFSGGIASATVIYDGGEIYISSGATASGTRVQSGGNEYVSGGSSYNATVLEGGVEHVVSGGTATSAQLVDGGKIFISGGTASKTNLLSASLEYVYASGVAIGTSLDANSAEYVSAGGTASSTQVQSSGVEYVYAGGTASGTVLNGGSQLVSGGTASGTIIVGSGSIDETAGVVVSAALTGETASLSLSGGATSGTTLLNGAQELVIGGVAYLTSVGGGESQEIVYNGGQASGTVVFSGGFELLSGGTATGDQVKGGTLTVDQNGSAAAANVSDGNLFVLFNGTTSGSLVKGFRSTELVSAFGTASATTLSSGGGQFVAGTASQTVINAGGFEDVEQGGQSISAMVNIGGSQAVSAGGTTVGTQVGHGAVEKVLAGGTAIGTIVYTGGELAVNGGAVANVILRGGTEVDGAGDPTSGAVISAGGVLIVGQGGEAQDTTISAGGTLVEAGGQVTSTFNSGGTVVSAGVVIEGPGGVVSTASATVGYDVTSGVTEYVLSGGVATGTTIGAGGVLDLAGGTASGGIVFAGSGGLLEIDDAAPATVISGFAAGDVIDLTGVPYVSGGTATLYGDPTLVVVEGGNTISLNFDGSVYSEGTFYTYEDAAGTGTDVALCFCAGTRIRTPGGEVAVEALGIGDWVTTLGGGAQRIRWIGRRDYDGRFVAGNPLVLPVRVARGALAPDVPARDLWVSPGHGLRVGGVLVPAWRLINGVTITQAAEVARVSYFHLELARHEILLAEGCQAESFYDEGLRGAFQNAHEAPGGEAARHGLARVEGGFLLQAIRQRLGSRTRAEAPAGRLIGFVDLAGDGVVAGWALDENQPEVPVALDILAEGRRVGRVLANRYRADLRAAGLGSGCHGFEFALPAGGVGEVGVRRASDGVWLDLTEAARRAA